MLESEFKKRFKKRFRTRIGLDVPMIILDLDPIVNRSKPDTIFLGVGKWAAVEFKKSRQARKQPNQRYYVKLMDEMGFAMFLSPEDEDEGIESLVAYFEQGKGGCVDVME